ncbi:hypothetical protein KAU15_02290, partial [candidate division WOR-3 bacterium]|nr:hypothetical protein [candidate division WOR-3 bacterium]
MVSGKEIAIKYIYAAIITYVVIFMTVTYPPIISFLGIECYLLIIISVIFAINYNGIFVLLLFFITGFIIDSYLITPLGFHSLFYIITVSLILYFRKMIYRNSFVLHISLVFIASLIYGIIMLIMNNSLISATYIIKKVILSPLFTISVFLFVRIIMFIIPFRISQNDAKK